MTTGPERKRGDRWAELLRSQGWWVQKLPASSTSGVPDWLRGHVDHGLVWTEAKTLEVVQQAPGRRPMNACTVAQRFWLSQIVRYGGRASLLVLSEDCWLDLEWALNGPGGGVWCDYVA